MTYENINPDTDMNFLSKMLEQAPELFYEFLKAPCNQEYVKWWVSGGCKSYRNYYSPALFQVIMITGELITENKLSFFGSYLRKGISNELACQIAREIFKHNPDPEDTNYYDNNLSVYIKNNIKKKGLTSRRGNERFLLFLYKHFKFPAMTSHQSNLPGPPIPSPAATHPAPALPPAPSAPALPPAPSAPAPTNLEDGANDSNSIDNYIWGGSAMPPVPTYDGHIQNYIDNMEEENSMYDAAYNS